MSACYAAPDLHEPRLVEVVEPLSPQQCMRSAMEGSDWMQRAKRQRSRYRKEILGYDFFAEITPGINSSNFRGRIDRAMATGKVDIVFS